MKKRIVQRVLGSGLSGVVVYLILILMPSWGYSHLDTDYLAVLNRPALAAADDEKAWPVYRDLWIKHWFCDSQKFDTRKFFLMDDKKSNGPRFVRPTDGDAWRIATERLGAVEDLLEGFRVGGIRPSFGLPLVTHQAKFLPADFRAIYPALDYEKVRADHQANTNNQNLGTLLEIPLHHIHVMQTAATLLVVDTRRAIEQDDLERATRNIEAIFGISAQVTESKLIVCSLFGLKINSLALDLVDECLNSAIRFSAPYLARIHQAVAKIRINDMIDIDGERMLFLDVVQKTYTDDGSGEGRVTAEGKAYWARVGELAEASIRRITSRKRLTEKADELFTRLDKCLESPGDEESLKGIEQELTELPASFMPLKVLFPNAFTIQHAIIREKMSVESVKAALAVIRFRNEHGRWPESLDNVVGDLLPEVPQDLLDGQSLRYQRRGDGFVIYSVGVNRVDDGGQAVMIREDGVFLADQSHEGNQEDLASLLTADYNLNENYPGDWILWPRHGFLEE